MSAGTARRGYRWVGGWLGIPCLVLALLLPGPRAAAQDPAKVAPQAIKVLLDNDRVRVLDDLNEPGGKEAMHSHPANVVHVLSGGKVRFTFPDGRTAVAEVKTGDTLYREAVTHAAENIGTTTIHLIIVELKKP